MSVAIIRNILLVVACALSGCALPVRQLDLSAPLVPASGHSFVLAQDVRCSIGTGYERTLRAGTRWSLFGTIDRGEVYRSPDQLLTVEGYNVHEAYLVVRDASLVGFYLPVEKKFTPVSRSVRLNLSSQQELQ
jgi:hypothetical protein